MWGNMPTARTDIKLYTDKGGYEIKQDRCGCIGGDSGMMLHCEIVAGPRKGKTLCPEEKGKMACAGWRNM